MPSRSRERVVSAEAVPPRAVSVLALTDYFLPGFRGGGPIRTLASLAARLGSALELRLITRDHDLGRADPYPGIRRDGWEDVGPVRVAYRRTGPLHPLRLLRLIRGAPHEVLYLNSCFSLHFAVQPLLLRRLGLLPAVRTVLAPRGELAVAALANKPRRKRVYLAVAKVFGIYRGVLWQASSEAEAGEIRREFGAGARVAVAPDVADALAELPPRTRVKAAGALRLVFLSRVVRKKNLSGALELLRGVRCPVELDVYGPREDPAYWEECVRIADALVPGVRMVYRGAVPHQRVPAVLREYDAMIFPTLNENFGHVVLEALSAGLPVLVSDRTRWRDLAAAGAGWDLPLEQPGAWTQALEACARWDETMWARWSAGARAAGRAYVEDSSVLAATLELFRGVAR